MMEVTPYGACGTVTGSCHVVAGGGARLVLDEERGQHAIKAEHGHPIPV